MLVAGPPDGLAALGAACVEAGVPITRLGTAGGNELVIEGVTPIPLTDLRTAWTDTLPRLFGSERRWDAQPMVARVDLEERDAVHRILDADR